MSQGQEDIDKCQSYTGKRYHGKFRGKVIFNNDPLFKGRIRALVPSVTAFVPSTWIEPASPFAGLGVGFFAVPPLNANVWVEFIEGNPSYPVYTGGYWDEKDLAPLLIPTQQRPLFTPNQIQIRTMTTTIIIDDLPPNPSITIETKIGQKVILNTAGIQIGVGPIGVDTIGPGITIDPTGNISIKGPTISIIGGSLTIASTSSGTIIK